MLLRRIPYHFGSVVHTRGFVKWFGVHLRTASQIDYCFIDSRILGVCKLEAITTPWATHEGLKLTIRLDRDALQARVVDAPRPFPFEDDRLRPRKDLARVRQMSTAELEEANVRSTERSMRDDGEW